MKFPSHPLLNPYQHQNNVERAAKQTIETEKPFEFTIAERKKGLSVIILNLNAKDLIIPLLKQLEIQQQFFSKQNIDLEILIGDTGSTEREVLDYYANNQFFKVIGNLKYHFSQCNNLVAEQHSSCSHLLFMNNDIILDNKKPDALINFFEHYQRLSDAGCLGIELLFPDHSIQHMGVDFFRKEEIKGLPFHPLSRQPQLIASEYSKVTRIPAVTGAFLMISAALFKQCDGMSNDYNRECQDIELCLKCSRFGFSNYLINLGEVIHIENGTRKKGEEDWQDRQLFIRRWSSFIDAFFL
ncbi:MAG: hypothetical protein QM479_14120 [Pseudomonadota bacterium]